MADDQNIMDLLSDLIRINNDRIAGYERAIKETENKDADLRTLFSGLAAESRKNITGLRRYITTNIADPGQETSLGGKIYRIWMDVKATFTGHDRNTILASCEFGEQSAQKAYESALEEKDLPPAIQQLIAEQLADLKTALESVRQHKDIETADR
jgi:uncharacterized protein (TIGR02284 family)